MYKKLNDTKNFLNLFKHQRSENLLQREQQKITKQKLKFKKMCPTVLKSFNTHFLTDTSFTSVKLSVTKIGLAASTE